MLSLCLKLHGILFLSLIGQVYAVYMFDMVRGVEVVGPVSRTERTECGWSI